MILHILLKTTLLLLFVTSLQAQISAFNCTSMLNEGPSPRGFSATKQQQQKNKKNNKKKLYIYIYIFFFKCQNRGCGLYGAAALSPANTVVFMHTDCKKYNSGPPSKKKLVWIKPWYTGLEIEEKKMIRRSYLPPIYFNLKNASSTFHKTIQFSYCVCKVQFAHIFF